MSTLDYPRREVFRYAPLQLVAAEIRYPYAPRLRRPEVLDALQIILEDLLPIRRQTQQVSVEIESSGAMSQQNQDVFRLFNRKSTASVSITPTAMTIETTEYGEFTDFCLLIDSILVALEETRAVAAVERVGLRYIDEVRVPDEIKSASDWNGWLADEVTAPSRILPESSLTYQGVIEAATGVEQKLVLRFAALDGAGVVGNDPLRRKDSPATGPFFVIDIDSFWEPSAPENLLECDAKQLLSRFESLHAPTGDAFQRTLTDRLRKLFREGQA